ncbi:MAG: hypothetical protein EOM20_08785, partial [Spartobacteria bacterium]|nr:hypothetical protein [Spartobacteria bacterium]
MELPGFSSPILIALSPSPIPAEQPPARSAKKECDYDQRIPPTSDLRPPTSDLRPPTSDLRPPTSD